MAEDSNSEDEAKKPAVAKSPADLQRIRLMKLMSNPEKPVFIPERPKQKNNPTVPEFVRNVMGSSAGAGSGEFHLYRSLRRKEMARQKQLEEERKRELLDQEYQQKREDAKRIAEEATAKKRAKRLKKKQKFRQKKLLKAENKLKEPENESESESESSDEKETAPATTET